RGAQSPAAVAIAITGPGHGAALVIAAPDGLGDLRFQRFLDDLPDRELDQLTPRVALGDTVGEQLVQLVACSLRGRYSRLHGDASSCRRRQPATLGLDSKQECIPVLFSSKPTPSPHRARLLPLHRDATGQAMYHSFALFQELRQRHAEDAD